MTCYQCGEKLTMQTAYQLPQLVRDAAGWVVAVVMCGKCWKEWREKQ